MRLVVWMVAWLLGLVLADVTQVEPLPALTGAGVAGMAALLLRTHPRAAHATLILLWAALGMLRYAVSPPLAPPGDISMGAGGEATVVGIVTEDPRRTAEQQRVLLAVEHVAERDGRALAAGRLLVVLPPYPAYRYGQRLAVSGRLVQPPEAERSGEFDYRTYLARRGIFVMMPAPDTAQVLPGGGGNPLLQALLGMRERCRRVLLRLLPEPQSSLAIGILLGLQSSIAPEVYTTFSLTGTSHILVISGWNISIIAAALYGAAERARLSPNRAFWAILACIWLYTLFVGASATVLRAAVMGSLAVLAKRTGRQSEPWTLLLAACGAMTLVNPQTLWDLGFQLSALATASLFAFGTPVGAWLERTPIAHPWLHWAHEPLTATLSAQILALPLILYHFGKLSIVAPLANIVLLPVVPYAMLLGTIALLAGLAWLPIGQLAAWPAWGLLAWLTSGAALFAGLPLAAVTLPRFPLWVLLAYYAVVMGAWLWNTTLAQNRRSPAPPSTAERGPLVGR